MSTGTFLSEAEPIDVEGNRIIIALASEFQFHKEALETTDNVEKTVRDVTAAKMKVTYVVTEKDGTESVIEEKKQKEKHAEIIESAARIFQGRTVRGL